MASPSDLTNPEAAAAIRKKKSGPQFKFLVPLVYAPVLPLIRLTLRKNPVVRDRLFTAVLVGAFAHGMYLVYANLLSVLMENNAENRYIRQRKQVNFNSL